MSVGIVAYGAYVPKYRLSSQEIKEFWGTVSAPAIDEKAFCGYDEDIVTMAVEASIHALRRSGIEGEEIGALFLATTSGPYEEKPNGSTVAAALSGSSRLRVVEITATPRAGGLALLGGWEFCRCWKRPALVVASDAPLAHPSSGLDHPLGAGAAAFVVDQEEGVTILEGVESVSIETFGERFRRRGERFVQDLELRQDELSGCVEETVSRLLQDLSIGTKDVDMVVLPDPDGATSRRLAKRLGFPQERVVSIVPKIGDAGTAGVLLGFVRALELAQGGQRVIVATYGAGCDAMSWVVGEKTVRARAEGMALEEFLNAGERRTYGEYLKFRRILSPSDDRG